MSRIIDIAGYQVDLLEIRSIGPYEPKAYGVAKTRSYSIYFKGGGSIQAHDTSSCLRGNIIQEWEVAVEAAFSAQVVPEQPAPTPEVHYPIGGSHE